MVVFRLVGMLLFFMATATGVAFAQQTPVPQDWGDLAGFQPAQACVQSGLTLGVDLTIDTQPRYDDADEADNGLVSYALDGKKLTLWVSIPGGIGYLQVFVDANVSDLWLTLNEWYVRNLDVATVIQDGVVIVTFDLPRDTETLRLRLALTDQPLTEEQVSQFAWALGCGEIEDYVIDLRAAPARPNVNVPAPTQTEPNDTGGNDNPPPDCHATNTCPPDDDDGDNDHCNAGGGNGAEPDENGDDCDPGNSGDHNNADDEDDDDNDHGGGGGHDNDGCNSGNGNGDEDCDPGNSEDHNNGGDEDSPNPGKGK